MVVVDRPMKAPSLHIYKSLIRETLFKFPQLSFCQKLFFSEPNSFMHMTMCLHCIGKYQIVPSKAVVGVDPPVYGHKHKILYKKPFRTTKGNKFFVQSICLAYMNMFARFDENPAMTLQDNKETKRYERTHR